MIFWSFIDSQYLTHNIILCMLAIIQFSMKTLCLKSLDTFVHELTIHEFILHLVHTQNSRNVHSIQFHALFCAFLDSKTTNFPENLSFLVEKTTFVVKLFKICFFYNIMETLSNFHICNPHRTLDIPDGPYMSKL